MLTYQFPDLNICPYTKLAKRFDDKDNYICILNSDNLPLDFNSLGINLKFTGSKNRVFIIHPVQLNIQYCATVQTQLFSLIVTLPHGKQQKL